MELHYKGDGVFVDKEKVSLKKVGPQEWSPRVLDLPIYPYVKFPSMERSEFGLVLTDGKPEGEWVDWEKVGGNRFAEHLAPLTDLNEALAIVGTGRRGMIEEYPFVEISDEEKYLELLAASLHQPTHGMIEEWDPKLREQAERESKWKGPGVYDLRDFSQHRKSIEEYEKDSLEFWAGEEIDGMFQGDEWEADFEKLVKRNS